MKMFAGLLLAAAPLAAQPYNIDGTVCRMNRSVDRMIVAIDSGPRIRVLLPRSLDITFQGHDYERSDLRLGDRVYIVARRDGSHMDATTLDVKNSTADALLRSHRTIVGRFGVREAKTEYFSLNLPGQNYVRVDAKAAYGPKGRVRVSSLKRGDLLEIRGSWPKKDLLQASSIRVMTNSEPSFCTSRARKGEISAATKAREADERKFLNKEDSDEE
jgi:hypothetical protein